MRRHDTGHAGLPAGLPEDLTAAISRAGYYPALVRDVVQCAVAGDEVVAHLVHQETTFDQEVIKRHVTLLVVTATRLVIAHADDFDGEDAPTVATATTEVVPLAAVRGVMLTHVVNNPEKFTPGTHQRDLTVTIGWGAVSRLDIIPAMCADETCTADHGYEGTIASDDISLRISSAAEGERAVAEAMAFAQILSSRIGR